MSRIRTNYSVLEDVQSQKCETAREASFSENSGAKEAPLPEPGRESSFPEESIADLARRGQSPIAIAQALGMHLGDVEMILKLQQLAASAGRRK